jgi:threonine dehydratase
MRFHSRRANLPRRIRRIPKLTGLRFACRTRRRSKIINHFVERIVSVSDQEIEEAMRAFFTDTHNVAEGAGAAPLAALIRERDQMRAAVGWDWF